jgi:hypothetical protein
VVRETFEARVAAMLDDFWMLTSNIYVKAPGAGRFEIHQNWPVTDDIRDTTITLWCPFSDVGPEHGTLNIVPGSHKLVPDIYTVTAPKFFGGFYDELIDHWLEPVSLRAGECLLFDDSLLHWSDVNRSDRVRWSAQLVFMPVEKTPVIYYLDEEHDPPHFELYEVSPEFFIERSIHDMLARPTGLPFYGTVECHNTQLTEDQFAELMRQGHEIRQRVYAGEPIDRAYAAALAFDRAAPA